MKNILVFHRLKRETFHKISHTVNQELIKISILLSADLTVDLGLVLNLSNKNLPQKDNQTSSNVVRFTTTNDVINEL